MITGYKGVIFDFNGTLFWDTALHNQAWDIFLETHGIHLSDEEKDKRMHGIMNHDILRSILDKPLSNREMEKMILEKEGIYQQICRKKALGLAPGVEKYLNFLKINNIPFTIATASGIENIDFYFDYLPLEQWFDRKLIVYNDGSFPGKPEPDIFLIAARRLALPIEDTIIFEDSFSGIKAAEQARAGKIVIVNSSGNDYSAYPHQIINNFDIIT